MSPIPRTSNAGDTDPHYEPTDASVPQKVEDSVGSRDDNPSAQCTCDFSDLTAFSAHRPDCPAKHQHRVFASGGGGYMGFVYEKHCRRTTVQDKEAWQARFIHTNKGWSTHQVNSERNGQR